jgi:hypothetical protein
LFILTQRFTINLHLYYINYAYIKLNPTTATTRLSAHIHRPAQTPVGAATAAQTRILGLLRRSAIRRLCGKLGRRSNRRVLLWRWHILSALGTGRTTRAAPHSGHPTAHRTTATTPHHRILLLLILYLGLPLLL